MLESKAKDLTLLMIHAIVARESTELPNLDPSTIRDCPKDKKLSQDHTVESSVLAVSSPKSSEPFCSNKWKLSKELRESPENEYFSQVII